MAVWFQNIRLFSGRFGFRPAVLSQFEGAAASLIRLATES
jgi:hypothetical protein